MKAAIFFIIIMNIKSEENEISPKNKKNPTKEKHMKLKIKHY